MYSIQQLLKGLRNPELAIEEVIRQTGKVHPVFSSLGKPIIQSLARRNHPTDFDEFKHPPDPFARIYVDPSSIEEFTGREWPPWRNKTEMLGKVCDGDWDRTDPTFCEKYGEECRPIYELFRSGSFSETPFYESLYAHFVHGVDWKETQFVRRCLELAEKDLPSWKGYTSREDILNHCKKVDELYETIREDGYKSQLELNRYYDPKSAAKEVTVDIGRGGELLFVNARHRLTIAKILELEEIPVGVLVRHKKWMEQRDRCHAKGEYSDHPDFQA